MFKLGLYGYGWLREQAIVLGAKDIHTPTHTLIHTRQIQLQCQLTHAYSVSYQAVEQGTWRRCVRTWKKRDRIEAYTNNQLFCEVLVHNI